MSREIKFRAWDKDKIKYVDGVGNLYMDILETGTNVFEVVQLCSGRYVIEQYTGLKDKNGKEIYEGDIVKIASEICDPSDIGIVGFDERKGIYDIYTVENRKVYWNSGSVMCSLMAREDFSCEVIGNIHENPELLEGEK